MPRFPLIACAQWSPSFVLLLYCLYLMHFSLNYILLVFPNFDTHLNQYHIYTYIFFTFFSKMIGPLRNKKIKKLGPLKIMSGGDTMQLV